MKMSKKKQAQRVGRTVQMLKRYRGLRDEFEMLKGVMCAPFGLPPGDYEIADQVFDGGMIAARMDAINAETKAKVLAA